MSSFDSGVVLRVITAPNSAFAQIRDNEDRYFGQSVGIFLFASFLGLLVMVPFVTMPLDETFYEVVGEENIDIGIPVDWIDASFFVGVSILTGIVSNVLFYFIGKKLGGNTNWKKVFAVLFYTYVPMIPLMIVMTMLVYLVWSTLVSIDPSYLIGSNVDEEKMISWLMPLLGYVGLIVTAAIGFVAWILVVSVKAVKTVNGFSTAKAFGLIILVMIISSIITSPLGM